MNKKIIATLAIGVVSLIGVSSTFANSTNNINVENPNFSKLNHPKMIHNLTTEEQSKLNSMSESEKKIFLDNKKSEFKAKKQSQEKVIDKLLAGEKLTADEEKIRQEIIVERANRKSKMTEMKNNGNFVKKSRKPNQNLDSQTNLQNGNQNIN